MALKLEKEMEIKLAAISDIEAIMEIINNAKAYLREHGSSQWNGEDGYPNIDTFLNDIKNNFCYIAIKNNKILGVMSLINTPDISYQKYNFWHFNDYISIHRIAINHNEYHIGVADKLISFAINYAKSKNISSIRCDTHKKNIPMQKLLIKHEFKYLNEIELVSNNQDNIRLAFEREV